MTSFLLLEYLKYDVKKLSIMGVDDPPTKDCVIWCDEMGQTQPRVECEEKIIPVILSI